MKKIEISVDDDLWEVLNSFVLELPQNKIDYSEAISLQLKKYDPNNLRSNLRQSLRTLADFRALHREYRDSTNPDRKRIGIETTKFTNLITHFLFQQFDINQKNHNNDSLLHQAITEDSFNLSCLLIEFGIETNRANNDGHTPLYLASRRGPIELSLKLLISDPELLTDIEFPGNHRFQSIAEVFSYTIFIAIEIDDLDLLKKVLNYAEELGKKLPGNKLLKHDAINMLNKDGVTALHLVTEQGKINFIDTLLEAGADPNKLSLLGDPPIFSVLNSINIGQSHVTIIKKYLNTGKVDVNDTNRLGRTLLTSYCIDQRYDLFRFLLIVGADINKQDSNGNTVLHIACRYGANIAIVNLLLAKNPSIVRDIGGFTALDYAVLYHVELTEVLKEHEQSDIHPMVKTIHVNDCKKALTNQRSIIEALLDIGAGIFSSCYRNLPVGVNTKNKLVIGLSIASQKVDRTYNGFAEAITNLEELKTAIKQNIDPKKLGLNRRMLLTECNRRLMCETDEQMKKNLTELYATLYQLPFESLVSLCLNSLKQSSEFRGEALEQPLLPESFKSWLQP